MSTSVMASYLGSYVRQANPRAGCGKCLWSHNSLGGNSTGGTVSSSCCGFHFSATRIPQSTQGNASASSLFADPTSPIAVAELKQTSWSAITLPRVGRFHGSDAVAELKHWTRTLSFGDLVSFHGVRAVAELKQVWAAGNRGGRPGFHGVRAVAELKLWGGVSHQRTGDVFPRRQSR